MAKFMRLYEGYSRLLQDQIRTAELTLLQGICSAWTSTSTIEVVGVVPEMLSASRVSTIQPATVQAAPMPVLRRARQRMELASMRIHILTRCM